MVRCIYVYIFESKVYSYMYAPNILSVFFLSSFLSSTKQFIVIINNKIKLYVQRIDFLCFVA